MTSRRTVAATLLACTTLLAGACGEGEPVEGPTSAEEIAAAAEDAAAAAEDAAAAAEDAAAAAEDATQAGREAASSAEEATAAADAATKPTEVRVTADEYSFELSRKPLRGRSIFSLENVGQEPHVMILVRIADDATFSEVLRTHGEDGTARELGSLEARAEEDSPDTLEVTLKPGSYGMLCPVETTPGETHFSLGQKRQFVIGR
ncbi:MAG: hypothetical protein ACR2IN_00700 [Thermoleophilaceae bacterium]